MCALVWSRQACEDDAAGTGRSLPFHWNERCRDAILIRWLVLPNATNLASLPNKCSDCERKICAVDKWSHSPVNPDKVDASSKGKAMKNSAVAAFVFAIAISGTAARADDTAPP